MNESAPPYPGPLNYPGGQPMYPPPPQGVQGGYAFNQVATTTVTPLMPLSLEDVPGRAVCPHCQQSVMTCTEHTSGLMTWLICGGLALIGCCLCCCFPFCIDSCKDVEHRCPSCQRIIYIYKRMK